MTVLTNLHTELDYNFLKKNLPKNKNCFGLVGRANLPLATNSITLRAGVLTYFQLYKPHTLSSHLKLRGSAATEPEN